jgi:ferrous iron transport protein A
MVPRLMPLCELHSREQGAVVELHGGRAFIARLAPLGFTPGASLTMVQNYGHGPLIVRVRDTRIALGRGEAAKIIVQRRARP